MDRTLLEKCQKEHLPCTGTASLPFFIDRHLCWFNYNLSQYPAVPTIYVNGVYWLDPGVYTPRMISCWIDNPMVMEDIQETDLTNEEYLDRLEEMEGSVTEQDTMRLLRKGELAPFMVAYEAAMKVLQENFKKEGI